jgi:hypothetical protein
MAVRSEEIADAGVPRDANIKLRAEPPSTAPQTGFPPQAEISDPKSKGILDEIRQKMDPNLQQFKIVGVKDTFLEGKLYTFSFCDSTGSPWWARAYKTGDRIEVFQTDEILLSVLGDRYRSSKINFLDPNLIAGYIAIIIAICIGYLIVARGEDVKIPDILANALTIILGYYFGRSTQK